ncbi:FAD-dependent oxidoreductase, partial [Alphaproteobacteria bacterium]|nr:FAD-dependent oxidoreductase [Alphaproteobacteria bacterium]
MKEITSDIVIVGAGLTGLTLAYGLSRLNIKIALLDKFNFLNMKNDTYDLRTTAISEGSKQFLDDVGVWNLLKKYNEPIKEINILDRKHSNSIYFSNKNKKQNLGYIVKNSVIRKALIRL